MIETAFWKRLDVAGHDAARIETLADGHRLEGRAVFWHEHGPASVSYRLDLAPDWSTRRGLVRGFAGELGFEHDIVREGDGWTLDGVAQPGLGHLLDLDLGFTPATNLQQLRRVRLEIGQEADIRVAWFDVGAERLVELPQYYRRLDEYRYAYRGFSYQATLELAPNGFVRLYPDLWEMD
ncbi:MAG: putative glycolipid-binding domain-containing protein [Mesorhizobium sp.]|nr:putative glycolipid-binding domain-containing protein [Mesorhizobium sp.]